jgi:hypothetical protein
LTIRTRKLIGAIILLALLVGWVLLGLALAPAVFSADNDLGAAVFYVVAGLGWLVVAMPLVKWMARPNPAPPPPPAGDPQQTP